MARPMLTMAGALIAIAAATAACVEALGLDQYQSAARRLCRCDEQLPRFAHDCTELLSDRLASASERTREAWLAFFADRCADSCQDAYACYAQRPTCVTSGLGCVADEECCDWSAGGIVRCESGQCRP